MRQPPLTRSDLALATVELARRDVRLRRIHARHGVPPLWARRSGFTTLVQIILEQQVSLASGRAAYARLVARAGGGTPERILAAGVAGLRSAGLTRQKAAYIHELAAEVVEGRFDPRGLAHMDDEAVRAALLERRGIGAWTADVYLLMALRRPDAFPSGDLALQIAAKEVLRLDRLPAPGALEAIAERWRPWRAVAARLLWHHYLRTRTRATARGRVRTRTQRTRYVSTPRVRGSAEEVTERARP